MPNSPRYFPSQGAGLVRSLEIFDPAEVIGGGFDRFLRDGFGSLVQVVRNLEDSGSLCRQGGDVSGDTRPVDDAGAGP